MLPARLQQHSFWLSGLVILCPPIVANLPYSLYAVLCVVVSVWYCMSDVNLSRMSLSGRGSASALSSGVMLSVVLSSSLSRRSTMLHGTDVEPWYTLWPIALVSVTVTYSTCCAFYAHTSKCTPPRRTTISATTVSATLKTISATHDVHIGYMSISASPWLSTLCVTDMVHNVAIFVCGGCGLWPMSV